MSRLIYSRDLSKCLFKSWHPNGKLCERKEYNSNKNRSMYERWNEKGELVEHYLIDTGLTGVPMLVPFRESCEKDMANPK